MGFLTNAIADAQRPRMSVQGTAATVGAQYAATVDALGAAETKSPQAPRADDIGERQAIAPSLLIDNAQVSGESVVTAHSGTPHFELHPSGNYLEAGGTDMQPFIDGGDRPSDNIAVGQGHPLLHMRNQRTASVAAPVEPLLGHTGKHRTSVSTDSPTTTTASAMPDSSDHGAMSPESISSSASRPQPQRLPIATALSQTVAADGLATVTPRPTDVKPAMRLSTPANLPPTDAAMPDVSGHGDVPPSLASMSDPASRPQPQRLPIATALTQAAATDGLATGTPGSIVGKSTTKSPTADFLSTTGLSAKPHFPNSPTASATPGMSSMGGQGNLQPLPQADQARISPPDGPVKVSPQPQTSISPGQWPLASASQAPWRPTMPSTHNTSRTGADRAAARAPQPAQTIRIGRIDVVVEAPATPTRQTPAPAPVSDFASRFYLRGP